MAACSHSKKWSIGVSKVFRVSNSGSDPASASSARSFALISSGVVIATLLQQPRTSALLGEMIHQISWTAYLQRQTPTPDAAIQCAAAGRRVHGSSDRVERQAGPTGSRCS